MQLQTIDDELLSHFNAKPGVKLKITLEIEAESGVPFDASLIRTVKENGQQLNVNGEFEEE